MDTQNEWIVGMAKSSKKDTNGWSIAKTQNEDIITEAQKRILEKAIERLESIGKEDRIESELHEAQCVCSICMSWEHRKEAIAELKSLIGEV